MNPKCRAQLDAARQEAGRGPMSEALASQIDSRLRATMRRLARSDQDWQSYSPDQRMLLAAETAARDMADEAARKVANAERQALRTAELEARLQVPKKGSRAADLVHDFERTNAYIDGVKRDYTRGLMDLIEAADNKQGAGLGRQALMVLFDAQNPQMTRDLALEVFAKGDGGTGNKAAQAGAKAWSSVTDSMRQRFNAGGGDVGKVDYGYLPQAHDQQRVMAAGAQRWVEDVLPSLDRSRYLREDGARMNDTEVSDLLRGAWETISTDGANKREPGAFTGSGARANRGSQSREIHFKDGEAYLAYLSKYGTGSMYDAMIGHIGGMSRDIGLVERYGPNPEAQMRVQFDRAGREAGTSTAELPRVFGNRPQAYWRLLNGSAGTPESARIAMVGQHARNIQTFGKLQGAVVSSLTDTATYFATVGYNKAGYFEGLKNIGRAATKESREFMNAHGMIAESLVSDLNRWAGENVAQSWSGRIANATMRLSLMNFWTDTMRRAFQLTHMQALGKMRSTAWDSLTQYDRWRMERAGLTADDWAVIQRAEPVAHNGGEFVTPDAIYATGDPRAGEVVAKYLGAISDESEVAVINPDLATRAITTGGASKAGTIDGELKRAAWQFKSFPLAMVSRHWRRMLDTPAGMEGAPLIANPAVYGGALMASLTLLGAVIFQSKQIITGKDPADMTTLKFWTKAVLQGGGLGFFGDVLLRDSTDDRSPQQGLFELLGPTAGAAAQVYELTKGNIDEYRAGKPTHAGAEALRFAQGHTPLVNLWYTKAALDHMVLHGVQENLSPGYLSRIRSKAKKDWGQEWWWEPGTQAPQRAPDIAGAFGQ